MNRVAMYNSYKKVVKRPSAEEIQIETQNIEKSTRKSRCSACISKSVETIKVCDGVIFIFEHRTRKMNLVHKAVTSMFLGILRIYSNISNKS